jgi:hypothetical protein
MRAMIKNGSDCRVKKGRLTSITDLRQRVKMGERREIGVNWQVRKRKSCGIRAVDEKNVTVCEERNSTRINGLWSCML